AWAFDQALEARDEAVDARKETEDALEDAVQARKDADRNAAKAHENEQTALKREKEADEARRDTEKQLRRAEWLGYGAKIALAQREWEDGNVERALDVLDSCQWNLRGWEHRYLYTLFTSNQKTLYHRGQLFAVEFSPDGKTVASAGMDEVVRVWDAETCQQLLALKGHSKAVGSVAFSSDGKLLASGAVDGVIAWDALSGKERFRIKQPADRGGGVAFKPSSNVVAFVVRSPTLDADQQAIELWDVAKRQRLHSLKCGEMASGGSIAFSADGKRLAAASRKQGVVRVWDLEK